MEWMTVLQLGLAVLLVVVTSVFFLFVYSGLLNKCKIRCDYPSSMPKRTAYRSYTGPYQNCADAFWKLCALVPKTTRLFGIYYDDPDIVNSEKTRYVVGCCLPDDGDHSLEEILQREGYTIWTLPTCSRALITEFPYRNTISIYLGIWKAYPALKKYIAENSIEVVGPFLEIYMDNCIQFLGVLNNNKAFYQPVSTSADNGSKKTVTFQQ